MTAETEKRAKIKDVSGIIRFPEVSNLSEHEYNEYIKKAFGNVEFFLGTIAVHGLEPQQIAANVTLAINKELKKHGLEEKPVILPYVSGHPIYGDRNREILQSVYKDHPNTVFLSEDLGRILIQTEFGLAGYQNHLESVRRNQPKVQKDLQKLIEKPIETISLDGTQRKTFNIPDEKENYKNRRIIELNVGANASAVTKDGRVDSHCIFPVTLDGLMELVKHHQDIFEYEEQLVNDIEKIAKELREKFGVILLNDIHTLATEPWFQTSFPNAIITPPLKEHLTPPEIQIDEKEHSITVKKTNGTQESAPNYHPEKGIIYINVSGSGLGGEAAKSFVVKAQSEGYVAAVPPWLKKQWLQQEKGKAHEKAMETVLAAEPEILFSKDSNGNNLCKLFFMRAGLGSVWYAQITETPMLVLGYEALESPEMWGNVNTITKNNIGKRYTGQPSAIEKTIQLQSNIKPFNEKMYKDYSIPEKMSGLTFAADVIMQAEVAKIINDKKL